MKKLFTLLLGLSTLLFISCDEDDENGNGEDYLAALVGEWMVVTQTNTGCTNSEYNGTLDLDNSSSLLVVINENETYSISQCGFIDESGTVEEVTATTITLCETGETDCDPENYTLVGNTLTVIASDVDDSGDMAGCQSSFILEKNRDPLDFLDPLVGTWDFVQMAIVNCSDAGTEDCVSDCPVLTVDDDCSYSFDDGGSNPETGYLVVADSWIVICPDDEDCDFEDDADTYQLTGTTLFVTTEDDDYPGCEVIYTFERSL